MKMNREFDNHLSARSGALAVSKIREIAEQGFDQPNVIPLWFGEGAWPSAENIVSSAVASLEAGDHFYQPNSGKMALREEVVRYTNRIYNASKASTALQSTSPSQLDYSENSIPQLGSQASGRTATHPYQGASDHLSPQVFP